VSDRDGRAQFVVCLEDLPTVVGSRRTFVGSWRRLKKSQPERTARIKLDERVVITGTRREAEGAEIVTVSPS